MPESLSNPPSPDASPAASPALGEVAGLRLLVVAAQHVAAERLAEALQGEPEGVGVIDHAADAAGALRRLGETPCDAVVVLAMGGANGRPLRAAVDDCTALRTAGLETPVLVLAEAPPVDGEADCLDACADAYACLGQSTPRSLLAVVRRIVRQGRIASEYRRLADAERRRLASDHREAEALLGEQRRLVEQLEVLDDQTSGFSLSLGEEILPPRDGGADQGGFDTEIKHRYRELLQTYVIMSAGRLHVVALGELVERLGPKSGRHVMSRADLLLVELMVHLADGYRHRYDPAA